MSQPFLGQLKIVAFNFAPRGWALANGQLLPINQNQALFSLLGTTYGGNGQTNFALPNLQGRMPLHVGTAFTLGASAGEETHTLTASEMPAHAHTIGAQTGAATPGLGPASGNTFASSQTQPYRSGGAPVALADASIGPAGASQPHENRQPFVVLNFIIALQGIFPSRN
ncbi:MAG: phage tail protein [Rudaea sp.]